MAFCKIRTKAYDKHKTKKNIKYKTQTSVPSLCFCASMLCSILYFTSIPWKFITKPINCEQICTFPLTVTDNQVSDWLIFCCGNLILYQKKK